jgi:hypothetical protein
MKTEVKNAIPVFIGGTGRSGTTILQKLMKTGSGFLSYPFELRLNVDPGGLLDLKTALVDHWSPYAADIALTRFAELMSDMRRKSRRTFYENRLLGRFGISPCRYPSIGFGNLIGDQAFEGICHRFLASLYQKKVPGHWGGSIPYRLKSCIYETTRMAESEFASAVQTFLQGLHDAYSCKLDIPYQAFIDDTPYSILHADQLLQVYPNAKFIHIYRDPRDVVASYVTKFWGGNDYIAIALRIGAVLEQWELVRGRLDTSSYNEIAMEGLLENPSSTLMRIADFIDVDTEFQIDSHDLSKGHSGRWKQDIPVSQQSEVNQILANSIERMGYDTDPN